MSATFWNMRRRQAAQKAREADKKVVVAENAKPAEKPKKGKVKTDA